MSEVCHIYIQCKSNVFLFLFRTNWLLSRQALAESRKVDRQYVTEQELIKVNIWFAQSELNFDYFFSLILI